jgi:hypothetical protein
MKVVRLLRLEARDAWGRGWGGVGGGESLTYEEAVKFRH